MNGALEPVFKVLHGGVSAMIAEGLGSLGALVGSGHKSIAGIQLSINHVKSALLGETVHAESHPSKLWQHNPGMGGSAVEG
ncbi:hypothetical protein SAY87_022470 [Trapa incisa]|uniref:Thioesterase domain-containing protein n=1 Tax=Trapa incisa TaxID=236973 RepID=A0AAN7K481_9MYRT|nr:hypothetical protein SAY87_022470 [Trapa incisa]